MNARWERVKNLLKQQSLQDGDQKYFTNTPYYRGVDESLNSGFNECKRQWGMRKVNDDVQLIEWKDHLAYYKILLNDQETVFGKLVFDGERIQYLYEEIIPNNAIIRYFCIIAYDGSAFDGYQKQLNKRTVQGVLEEALYNVFKKKIQVHGSGRTDKGVHAYHQSIHFDGKTNIPINKLMMVIRQYLPEDIVIKSIEEKPPIFHVRYDVTSKTYMYHIDYGKFDVTKRNYRWFVDPFNIEAFKKALLSVIGEHDFYSFTKTTDKNTIREILHISFEENTTDMKIWIKGSGFLRYMVRNLIMAAYLISINQLSISMEELLKSKDNTILRHIASPSGLYLYDVSYD